MPEEALQAAFEIKTACDEISRRLLRWHWEHKPGAHSLGALLDHVAQRQQESPDYYDRMPDLSGKNSWQQLDTTICMRVLLDPEKDAAKPLDLLGNTSDPGAARRACNAVLEYEHFDEPAEISVTFVDNAAIAELNNQYRNKPMPTDVLSFPLGENGVYDVDENNGCKMLGDIVISMERAQEQATLYGHPLQREVAFLTVHSMLHLLGYDHENGGLEAMRMREKEEAVLTQLGLPRTVSYTE